MMTIKFTILYVSSYSYKYPIIKIDASSYEQYSEIISVDLDRNNVLTRLYHIAIHIQLPDKNKE